VAAPCQKYQYTTAPCHHVQKLFHTYPQRYLDLSYLQLESMEIEDRPPDYADMLLRTESGFRWIGKPEYKLPEYWKYYDDEVQQILRAR
jgi:hypothetical protein